MVVDQRGHSVVNNKKSFKIRAMRRNRRRRQRQAGGTSCSHTLVAVSPPPLSSSVALSYSTFRTRLFEQVVEHNSCLGKALCGWCDFLSSSELNLIWLRIIVSSSSYLVSILVLKIYTWPGMVPGIVDKFVCRDIWANQMISQKYEFNSLPGLLNYLQCYLSRTAFCQFGQIICYMCI